MNDNSHNMNGYNASQGGLSKDGRPFDLLEQLDRATVSGENQVEGASRVVSAELNDKSVALRDTWLAFGRLLETADSTWGKAPSIPMPREAVLPASRQVAVERPSIWRRTSAAMLVVAACIAGVALIVAQWRFLMSSNGNNSIGNNIANVSKESAAGAAVPEPQKIVGNPQPQKAPIQQPKSSVVASAGPENGAVASIQIPPDQKPTAQKPAPSAEWDDPEDKQIDQEISAVELDIAITRREWDQQGEAAQAIEYRINEDEQEADKDPL